MLKNLVCLGKSNHFFHQTMQWERQNCFFLQPLPTVFLHKLIVGKAQIPTFRMDGLMRKLMFEVSFFLYDYFFHNPPSTQNDIQIPVSGIALQQGELV